MKTLIVGGRFGTDSKQSSVITKISHLFDDVTMVNGGSLEVLKDLTSTLEYELILWMPEVMNEEKKLDIDLIYVRQVVIQSHLI